MKPLCSIPECGSPVRAKAVCGAHYQVLRRQGLPKCSVDECTRKANCKGLCGAHYRQARVAQNPPCYAEGCSRNSVHEGLCSTHHSQKWRLGYLIPDAVECLSCGESFRRSEFRFQGSTRRCSSCQIKHASKHRWCMSVEELAARDGLACVICHLPVDLTLRRPDPMSPSVEHLTPRALGGQDVPENLALAHLLCNCRSGGQMSNGGLGLEVHG